jgi:beta-mannosidase
MRPSLFTLPFALLTSAKHVTNLSETTWTLSNDALNISVPACLPSQAHLDLFAAGVIGDPYHDLNDFNLRWIVWQNWTYSSALRGVSGKSNGSSTWLQFNGLDTFADISLCGCHVANTNNQFRQWWFDVSEIVAGCEEEEPVLELNFGSAPVIANHIADEPGAETWPYGV